MSLVNLECKRFERKLGTRLACLYCNSENNIWCAYSGSKTHYHCRNCNGHWECGVEVCTMKQLASPSKCVLAFHGLWFNEERKQLEKAFENIVNYSEWGFLRTRLFYSAWRLSEQSKIYIAKDVESLAKIVINASSRKSNGR